MAFSIEPMMNRQLRAALAALLTACAACDRSGGQSSERGVWTEQTAWRAVEEPRLGRADGAGPDVFGMPAALEVDAYGRLYVLEAQAGQVRVFDADGRHVRSFGRQGAGPGELAQPMGMAMAPGGAALWVVDPGNSRYSVFDTTGAVRNTIRRASGLAMFPWPGRFDRQGRLWDVAAGADGMAGPPALLRLDPASGHTERFPLPSFKPPQFSGPASIVAPVPYAPELAWALDADGRLWSGVTDRYRLTLHEPGGGTVRAAERAAAPVPVAASERDSIPAQFKWFTDQGGRVDLSRVPRHKPAFVSIRTDDRGWLWVRPTLPAGESGTAFDVFDPDGRYQGRLALPIQHQDGMPLVIRGDRIYAVVQNEAGVPQVARFRLEGRAPAQTRVAASR